MENIGRPFDHLKVFVYDWSFVQLPWSNNIAKFMLECSLIKGSLLILNIDETSSGTHSSPVFTNRSFKVFYASGLYYKFTIQLRMYNIIRNEILVEFLILVELQFP